MSGEHYVTVTAAPADEDGWRPPALVEFECRGNRDSKCHQYPDCDCEGWDDEHEHLFVPHNECWVQGWFDSEYGAVYDGEDADDMDESCVPRDMTKAGPVTVSYEDEYLSWEFEA